MALNTAMEETIKQETDRLINNLKVQSMAKGLFISEKDEMYLRMGISYGISISAMALAKVDGNITLKEN